MSSDEFDFSEDDQSNHSDASPDPSDDDSFREENDHPNKKIKRISTIKASTKRSRPTTAKSNAKKSIQPHEYSDEESYPDEMNLDPIQGNKKGRKTIEETYQKKTQLEHILLRPDTYIGSVEPLTQQMFVVSESNDSQQPTIQQREITYTPGLFKIFDEILVNAADNKQRDPNMDKLEIVINKEVISVWNNGRGIPVEWHKDEDCYVPTLIFGDLLTGSNFDDNEKKTTGGRNGYGAKLANIFSTEFIVECLDSARGKKFKQFFRKNNMIREDPIIKDCSEAEKKRGDYTKITFKPDLKRFHMTHLDRDTIALLSKRVYDIAGSMGGNRVGKKLNVYLNESKIPVKDFKSYLALYEGINPPDAYEKIGDHWEVGVSASDGSFNQISFVNAIATTKGGGHVNYIADLVAKSLQAAVKKKNKGGKEIKPAQIKNHLSIFVNCLVENPTFDSQTKENLTTRPATFKASNVIPSDKFMKQVEKSGVIEAIMSYAKFKENQALKRKNGTKKSKLTGIAKLDDANFAGTAKSKDCTLIITEGDSAKSLAVSGLSVVGRDYYGVFPLKGKPLNVRDATHAQIMKNEEISNLMQIMGLKFGTEYTEDNIKSLRYGHLMIMADQDHDGSHIKGLIINFIHNFWPSLLDIPDFLIQFITPIVKCTKGKKSHTFFTLPEYEEWKEETGNDAKGWTIKYYKGLGTSTSSEAKEYFSNLDTHEIHFNEISSDTIPIDEDDMDEDAMTGEAITSGSGFIEMAFSKSKADARKKWLNSMEKNTFLDYSAAQKKGVNYSDFINKELILFSNADNARSIPHIMDGFKPSQRKVLFACFKKKLKTEIKVAQLAGYIGEHSAYHHGDMSLNGTIIGMAQSYVGSNNVNLLYPSGQFGTRRMGGKDHASARYIFTRLEKIARAIFHPDDDDLLNYLNDDGLSVEPEYYMPVIPMVLVNGSDGIGTGYSSTIQTHDPREIIENIRKMINGEEPDLIHPYFEGFAGEITAETGKKQGSYIIRGKIERTNDTTLLITELPIGRWTQDYKASVLEAMVSGTDKSPGEIIDFKENHTDSTVSFTINATEEKIDEFEKFKGGLHGKFKLSTNISTNNMTAFDIDGKLHKYATTKDILRVFFDLRLEYYVKRKALLLEKMRRELKILDNKARFVEEVCSGDLVVSNRKRAELLADLQERAYDLFPKDDKKADDENDDDEEEIIEESATSADLAKGYEYLLGMKIWSLTFERAEELRRQLAEKMEQVSTLEATEHQTIWLNDLNVIEEALDERDVEYAAQNKKEKQAQSKAKVRASKQASAAAKKAKKASKKKDEWDSDVEMSDEDDDDDFVVYRREAERGGSVTAKRAKKATKKKEERDSDLEMSGEEDDDFVVNKSAPKPKAKPKKVAAPKPAAKPAPKPADKKANKIKANHDGGSDLDDSDEEDDFKAVEPKPKAKKNTPPKKQLISFGCSSGSSRDKPNSSDAAKKSSAKKNEDEYMEDSVEDEICKPSASNAKSSRARRSRVNVSYADESSEEEREDEDFDESGDELDGPEVPEKKRASNSTKESKMKMLEDEWTFDDDMDEDDYTSQNKTDSKALETKKKARPSKPDPSRVFQSISTANDDDLVDGQSFGSPSPIKKKALKAAKKAPPKKKSPPAAKAKVEKKKTTGKSFLKKPAKSVCDLSSDSEDDFLDDGVGSDGDSIMEDVAHTGRSRNRASYHYKSSEEEEFDEDSEVEFD